MLVSFSKNPPYARGLPRLVLSPCKAMKPMLLASVKRSALLVSLLKGISAVLGLLLLLLLLLRALWEEEEKDALMPLLLVLEMRGLAKGLLCVQLISSM